MRRASLVTAAVASFATVGAVWSGCYSLSSDCTVLLTCGAGGASSASSGSTTSTGGATTSTGSGATTTSTGGSVNVSASSSGTGGASSSSSGGTTCSNGKKDGNETDVDCGGSCPKCTQGQTCGAAADCTTGNCVDGVCCGDSTCPSCQSCAIPGKEGSCVDLPKGADDPVAPCVFSVTCNVGHMCTVTSLGHLGDTCSGTASCFNGVCAGGRCKLAAGDPCFENVSCSSNLCQSHVCTPCVTSSECGTGTCAAGACTLAGGDPCAGDSDCGTTGCVGNICSSPSGSCTLAGCPTHYCGGSADVCETCSVSGDCPGNTPCTGGSCGAPPGAFCTSNADCASSTCASATLLDFRRCM